jgi:hypothetical protein
MTAAQQLLQRYQDGRFTTTGLILAVLSLTNKRVLMETLEILPRNVLRELKAFVDDYRPRMKIFRGPRPRGANVRLVREWFVSAARSA